MSSSPHLRSTILRWSGLASVREIASWWRIPPVGIRAGEASGALVCALRPRPSVSLDQGEMDVVVELFARLNYDDR